MQRAMLRQSISRRRFLAILGAASVAAVTTTGCQSVRDALGGEDSGGSESTVRYMGHFTPIGDTARDHAQTEIEEAFKDEHPNINIEWEQTNWEQIGENYMAAWSAGTEPDISLFSPANITPAVRLGSLEDLTPFFEDWPEDEKDDFSSAWWDSCTYEGEKYAAPLLLFGSLMLYRKSKFDEIGVDTGDIRSWQQFVDALQQIVVDGEGRNPTDSNFDSSTVEMWGWHWYLARGSGAGIPWFGDLNHDLLGRYDLGPPDWRADHWTEPELVEAVQFVVDWVNEYQIQPRSSLTYNLEDADNRFVNGASAAYQFGTHRFGSWLERMQFPPDDIVWARIPTWDGDRFGPTFANHWSMGVSSNSEQTEAAVTVTEFWMSREADLIMTGTAGQQPRRASVLDDPIVEGPEFGYVRLFDEAMRDWSEPLLSPPVRPTEIFIQAYHSMVNDGVPAETALAEARDTYHSRLEDIPADTLPQY